MEDPALMRIRLSIVRALVTITTELVKQASVAEWIDGHLTRSFPIGERRHVALLCFDLAIEHHSAICSLAHEKHFGSMYALLRVAFEAFARGLWIRHAATEADLIKFKEDKMELGMKALIDLVEQRLGAANGALTTIKTKHWPIFCSFTHTGYQALVRRAKEDRTGSVNYPDEEVVIGLRFAGWIALMSAVELASISGDQVLIDSALEKARVY